MHIHTQTQTQTHKQKQSLPGQRNARTGTFFPEFADFLQNITHRGIGAFELLAMELKSAGAYVSRGLSFKHCEFDTVRSMP